MAESQLMCMEDGHINAKVPESKPEFYYSEEQRAAIEQLLRNGDSAFKTRLQEDETKDFLSAREIKWITSAFRSYNDENKSKSKAQEGASSDTDSGVHSTYWPQMSDTEVPPLDIGWPSGGFFRGVTRVAVHTHPPKDNGPHVKEVVRRLIQEASKVIAIVMDMLTDLHILQDLMDAAWRRSVPIYILLDAQGVPHFLDMCSRLQIGAQHLRNIRTRTLQGTGFALSFGRLPGSLCNKYMLVDGDKVMFGSYSFSWCTSRMDRNMITVMTGQVVDFFDRDFRELYAISDKLNLYKEFHISPPADTATLTHTKVGPKRPPLPATTSRFQVSLGDSRKDDIKVPAHKYHNPKYFLVFGDRPRPTGSLQEPGARKASVLAEVPEEMDPGRPRGASSEKMDRLSPLPSEEPNESFKRPNGVRQDKKTRPSFRQRLFPGKSGSKLSINSMASSRCPSPTESNRIDEGEDSFDVVVKSSSKWKSKKLSKMGAKSESVPAFNTGQDNESMTSRQRSKPSCTVS
ncbi:protein FAM83F-like [Centroberyx affinis]|uniref:protein FAM83F-like n=1 Tax=Centroberyx affinis TaxID=166261 RepID=UPI003A5BC8FE